MFVSLFIVVQVGLPPNLIEPRIQNMQVGDYGYAYAGEMNVDKNGKCYLNPRAFIKKNVSPVLASILIVRKADGFEVELLDHTYKWELSTEDLKDWIPVKKFKIRR